MMEVHLPMVTCLRLHFESLQSSWQLLGWSLHANVHIPGQLLHGVKKMYLCHTSIKGRGTGDGYLQKKCSMNSPTCFLLKFCSLNVWIKLSSSIHWTWKNSWTFNPPPHPYAYFTTWRHSSVNESPLPVECPAVLHGGHFRRNLRPLFRLIGSIKGSVRQRASRRISIQHGVFLPSKDWRLGTVWHLSAGVF